MGIILPNVYTKWITHPSQWKSEILDASIAKIFDDSTFISFLQWKRHQNLLFCMLNEIKQVFSWNLSHCDTTVAPFWSYLSKSLTQTSDPSTYNTSNYNPLILDFAYYGSTSFVPKYATSGEQIIDALENGENVKLDTIMEILH